MKIITALLAFVLSAQGVGGKGGFGGKGGIGGGASSGAPSAVGNWLLNEGTGSTALDSSGNGNNGTWNGTASCSGTYYAASVLMPLPYSGCFGVAASNFIDLGGSSTIAPTAAVTITAWVNPRVNTGIRVISNLTPGATYNGIDIFYNGVTPHFNFQVGNAGTLLDAVSTSSTPINNWYFVGATYDGTTGTIWINGSAEGTFTGASAIGTSSQHMMIGEWPGAPTGTYWYGYQANVCIFNQSIDATQMARMNTAGPGTCLPGAP